MTKKQLAEIRARHAEQGEHGIDAQTMWDDLGTALAEIERGWAEIERLTAPVDVEKEVEKLNGQIVHCDSTFEVLSVVRPLVTDRARLAREVERLSRPEPRSPLQRWSRDEQVGALKDERDAARAEIARLTAVKSAEIAPIIERFQAAFGADTPRAPSFTAAQGEAWERLAKALDAKAAEEAKRAKEERFEPGEWEHGAARDAYEDAAEMVRAALAAAEPRGASETATRPEDVDPIDTWVGGEPVPCAAPDITAITHDFRPGAQDGMPRLADVEAVGPCPVCGSRHVPVCDAWWSAAPLTPAETREPIASAPGQIGPPAEVTDADRVEDFELIEVAEMYRRWQSTNGTESEAAEHRLDVLGHSLLPRLARAEQARRAAEAKRAADDAAYQEHVRRELAARAEQRPACCAAILSTMRDVRKSAVFGWCVDDLICKFCPFCGHPMPGTDALRASVKR